MGDQQLIENLRRCNGYIIREAIEEDLPFLLSESDAVYMQFLFQSAFQGAQRGEQFMWVVECEGIIIGQVFVQYSSMRPQLANGIDRAYFYSFRVAPDYRNQGVGSMLLSTMENDLRMRGFTMVTLTVAKTNDRAIQLYTRLGYRIAGSETVHHNVKNGKNRWNREKEEAWRMEKRL